MKVIEILIYGLGVLEFPFDETQKCRPQASDILKQNTIVVNRIDPPEFWAEGDYWIKDGKLKYTEDVTVGLENAPTTFIGMLKGDNFGKTLIKIFE